MSLRALLVALLFGSFGVAHAQQPAGIDDLLKSIVDSTAQLVKVLDEQVSSVVEEVIAGQSASQGAPDISTVATGMQDLAKCAHQHGGLTLTLTLTL